MKRMMITLLLLLALLPLPALAGPEGLCDPVPAALTERIVRKSQHRRSNSEDDVPLCLLENLVYISATRIRSKNFTSFVPSQQLFREGFLRLSAGQDSQYARTIMVFHENIDFRAYPWRQGCVWRTDDNQPPCVFEHSANRFT